MYWNAIQILYINQLLKIVISKRTMGNSLIIKRVGLSAGTSLSELFEWNPPSKGWLYSKAKQRETTRIVLEQSLCVYYISFSYGKWKFYLWICIGTSWPVKDIWILLWHHQVQCFTENCNKKFYINSARLRYTIYHNNTTKKPMSFTVCLLTPFFKDQTIWFYSIFSNYTKVVLMWGILKLQDEALASLLIRPIRVQAMQKAKLIATSEEFI